MKSKRLMKVVTDTVRAVGAEKGVNPAAIYGHSRIRAVVACRDEAIRKLAYVHGLSNGEIARQLGMDPSSIWAALNRDQKRARNTAWTRKAQAEAVRGE
jgi:hypothetical protein